jgi:hypothetical protein
MSDFEFDEVEYESMPKLNWNVYQDTAKLKRPEIWSLAIKTRKRAAIQQLMEQYTAGRKMAAKTPRVLVIVTGKNPAEPGEGEEYKVGSWEGLIAASRRAQEEAKQRSRKPSGYKEHQTLFLLPFKFEDMDKPSS